MRINKNKKKNNNYGNNKKALYHAEDPFFINSLIFAIKRMKKLMPKTNINSK
ncbi:MAG: hypothetical protein IKP28_01050 [Clostridia bacterium]|nr:hypothetical protein [Clostridia bacterium]